MLLFSLALITDGCVTIGAVPPNLVLERAESLDEIGPTSFISRGYDRDQFTNHGKQLLVLILMLHD